jgi:hypothetical protein
MSIANENDRLKAQASYLNTLSAAALVTGVMAPIAGMVITRNPDLVEKPLVAVIVVSYLFLTWFLHRKSRNVLNGLLDD